jgi:hypothetical protein
MPFFSRLEPMMTSLLNGLLGALEKIREKSSLETC